MRTKRTLSPRDLARAIGASESSLKRWADEGRVEFTRTAGGHRRIALDEAIRFVRASGMALRLPEALGLEEFRGLEDVPALPGQEQLTLLDHLRAGRSRAARGLLLWMYASGTGLAALCDGPIRGCLAEIGEQWQHDDRGILLEHRATEICIQALEALRLLLDVPDGAPRAVGGGMREDPYTLPTLMAATVLMGEGFETTNLGPNSPAEILVAAAKESDARLVWLSATSASLSDETIAAEMKKLREGLRGSAATIALGGRRRDQLRASTTQDVFLGASMAELAAFARGIVTAPS